MQARDIMSVPPITVAPDTPVAQVAATLLDHRISAVPVVEADGTVAGIVSEGDLVRRQASERPRSASWWLALLAADDERSQDYIRTHGRQASDVMTRDVVGVDEEASIADIANLLERHRIKRVPVLRDGKVVGIVSRANLLHALAGHSPEPPAAGDDRALRERVQAELREAGVAPASVNALVRSGVVHLWGTVSSPTELEAARLAARNAAPGALIEDHLSIVPRMMSRHGL